MKKDLRRTKRTFVTGFDASNLDHSLYSKWNYSSLNIGSNQDFDKLSKKKNLNLHEKVMFTPPYEKYYSKISEIYDITPGIQFIKKLFSHDKSDQAIKSLHLNMPETYWNDTEMFYIYNDKITRALKMIRNRKEFDLFENIYQIEKNQYRRQLKPIDPFIVIKTRESEFENSIKVERFEKAHDNLGKDIGEGLVQRYIRCRGRNRNLDKSKMMQRNNSYCQKTSREINSFNEMNLSQRTKEENSTNVLNSKLPLKVYFDERKGSLTQPTVIRLEYKTAHNSTKGGNVAYCLINKKYVEKSIQSGSKEVIEKYNELTTVNSKNEKSFDIYVMSGESVAPYEYYANQLIIYLQKWLKLFLKTIVCDFTKDERGIIYFLGVKSFTLVKDPNELMGLKPEKILMKASKEHNKQKFYETLTCRLCLLPYPKSKIANIVTFKLLYNLKDNLKKRAFRYFEHINKNIYNESLSCRVCDLCYKLLLTEQELMEIQKTIALCTGIDVQNDELLSNETQSPDNLALSSQKYEQLTQWRIIFYFLKFYFIDYSKLPFKEEKDSLKTDKNINKTNYKLSIELFNQSFTIPIFSEMKNFISKDEVEINSAKMIYFFSADYSNVKHVLRNEEINFKIILNNKWNEPIAQCKTTCFSFYDDIVKEKPLTSKLILNFFSDFIKHFKCQLYFGLKHDGLVPTASLNLYCYKAPNTIYLTDMDYYSYHPLPNDWYELFIPPDTKVQEDSFNIVENEVQQLLKDLEGKEKKKRKYEPVVYDPYDIMVEAQNKNNLVEKINSVPIVIDKAFLDMKLEERKQRPLTSRLIEKFNLPRSNSFFLNKKKSNKENEMPNLHHPAFIESKVKFSKNFSSEINKFLPDLSN